jgi:predicted phosphodiesterase
VKIAYAGDWHGNYRWARLAIEYAADLGAETILHLGDYGYDFSPDFRTSLEASLRRTNLTLQFVDGNHEDFTWLYKQPIGEDGRRQISEHVHHLPRGYRWEWDGVRFLAMGGAYSVDRRWRQLGVSWWSEEVITEEEIERAQAGGETDIMISHDVPQGVQVPGLNSSQWPRLEILRAEEHREQLRKVTDVAKPREVWHGHYHICYDRKVDLGYGPVLVHGLSMDATDLALNMAVIELVPLDYGVQSNPTV